MESISFNTELFYLRRSISNRIVILSMQPTYLLRITILLSLAFIASCSPGTDPGECTIGCQEVRVDLDLISRRDTFADTSYLTLRAEAEFQFNGRGDVDVNRVNVGSVEVNSEVLVPESGPNGLYRMLLMSRTNPPSSLRIAPEGMFNTWLITGGPDMYSIRDSIITPTSPVSLLAPSARDTLSLSQDFVIRRATVPIGDTADYFLSIVAEQENDDNRPFYVGYFATTRTDTLLVPAEDLATLGFDPGPITISLHRSEYHQNKTVDGRFYTLHFHQYDVIHTAFRR
jgi:hypothetical protein